MKTITIITILSTFFILTTLYLDYQNKKLQKLIRYYQSKEDKQNE